MYTPIHAIVRRHNAKQRPQKRRRYGDDDNYNIVRTAGNCTFTAAAAGFYRRQLSQMHLAVADTRLRGGEWAQ